MSAIPQCKTQNHSTQTLTHSPHLKAVNNNMNVKAYRHIQYVVMHVLECIRINRETNSFVVSWISGFWVSCMQETSMWQVWVMLTID